MDKLQVFTAFMKKYLFWLLTGAVVVVGFFFYWWASRSLATEFQVQKAKVDLQFTDVDKILDKEEPPNQEYIEKVKEKQDELKEKVFRAWDALYQEQKEKNLWPKELGDEFIKKIQELGPEDEIPQKYRYWYWNRIKEYFPKLTEIIDLYRPKETPAGEAAEAGPENIPRGGPAYLLPRPYGGPRHGGPAYGGIGTNQTVEMVGVVDWKKEDYDRLTAKFTSWTSTPSTKAVRLAQEDLWVIESLLKVIRATNGNVKEHLLAPIKGIEALQIGADAIPAWDAANQTVFQGGAAAGESSGTTAAEPQGMYQRAAPPGAPSAAMFGPEKSATITDPDQLLLVDRYVDYQGTPLAPGAAPPSAEFKMIPLCMRLYMDQRSITKLLVECANSAMPIEVRRVRLQPDTGQAISLGSPTSGGAGGGSMVSGRATAYPHGAGGYGHYPVPRPPMGEETPRQPQGTGGEPSGRETLDLVVEIQGIIHIYNPPDEKKLGTGSAREQAAEGASPPAAAPPATPGGENPAPPPAVTN